MEVKCRFPVIIIKTPTLAIGLFEDYSLSMCYILIFFWICPWITLNNLDKNFVVARFIVKKQVNGIAEINFL